MMNFFHEGMTDDFVILAIEQPPRSETLINAFLADREMALQAFSAVPKQT